MLEALRDSSVEFVVIGGVAGVIHGSTQQVTIVLENMLRPRSAEPETIGRRAPPFPPSSAWLSRWLAFCLGRRNFSERNSLRLEDRSWLLEAREADPE
jgi:hypothetical protein